jgi:hypothetical protein
MNITAPLKVTKAEFYEFVQAQAEGRFEWERGRIVQQMTGGTFDHTQIAQRIRDCLRPGARPLRLHPLLRHCVAKARPVMMIDA